MVGSSDLGGEKWSGATILGGESCLTCRAVKRSLFLLECVPVYVSCIANLEEKERWGVCGRKDI